MHQILEILEILEVIQEIHPQAREIGKALKRTIHPQVCCRTRQHTTDILAPTSFLSITSSVTDLRALHLDGLAYEALAHADIFLAL